MTNVDQFESVFNAAAKDFFVYRQVAPSSIVVMTDLTPADAEALTDKLKKFLGILGQQSQWTALSGDQCASVEQLLDTVEELGPELVITYRNLHSAAWQWPHSLGPHLDVLTQATDCPVLVIPHPKEEQNRTWILQDTNRVMAVTDHLAGDHRLVNAAIGFTKPGGTLILGHVESENTFERYLDVISRIPSIDTDNAREEILRQLLKEPRDYIRSCQREIADHSIDLNTECVVQTGHRLTEYKNLIEQHRVELVVINTKDEDQHAMHGLTYPLAIELRQTPLLML